MTSPLLWQVHYIYILNFTDKTNEPGNKSSLEKISAESAVKYQNLNLIIAFSDCLFTKGEVPKGYETVQVVP